MTGSRRGQPLMSYRESVQRWFELLELDKGP